MSLPSFFVRKNVFVNLLALIVIVVGLFISFNMKREVFPVVELDYVIVMTSYPGASPEEVEKLVTRPIEEAIENIDGIDTYSSGSRESFSTVFIELDPDLKNRDRVINKIGREVDKADIPDDAEDPEVEELDIDHPAIEIAFSGKDVSEKELRRYVDGFETKLKNIKGVGKINKLGWKDQEIWIEVNPNSLRHYHLSLTQVITAIRRQNVNLPGGKMSQGSKETIIRTLGEISTLREFGDVIVRTNADGQCVYVKDIANVREEFEDEEDIYKTNGKISINLVPMKKDSGDTIDIVDDIKALVKEYRKEIPPSISIDLLNDMAFYVKRRLSVLVSNGLLGLGLLLLTLLLFLNFRVAFVTALGIPFAFMLALIMMSFFNVSLNMITMFGLILVLGMIVDDAIVVAENSYRYMEKGLSPMDATIKGVNEVMAPVTTTILTTIAAFMPLMFIDGIMGKFLRYFPMGVIFCLIASLFEALIILPAHLAEWVRPLVSNHEKEQMNNNKPRSNNVIVRFFRFFKEHLFSHDRKGGEAIWFQFILNVYTKILKFAINYKYVVAFLACVILASSVLFAVKKLPFQLFPDFIETFFIQVECQDGTSSQGTNEVISKIEQIVLKLPKTELDNLTTTVGSIGDPGGGPLNKYGSKYGQCVVYLTPIADRDRDAAVIMDEIREKVLEKNIKGIKNIKFEKLKGGPPVGKPISVDITGDDLKTLDLISKKVMAGMGKIDGIKDIQDTYEKGKEEILIIIDYKEAARLGLSVFQIATTIRFAFEGGIATSVRTGTEEIEIRVKLPESYKGNINTLKNLTIPNKNDRLIELKKVAKLIKGFGIKSISHKDGKRVVNITANIDPEKFTAVSANRAIMPGLKEVFSDYPTYSFSLGGEWEDTSKSLKSLSRALIIAFMLIYLILASQFNSFVQPIIIMISVPFGFVGVIFALFFHGEPVSMMALFGVIGLIGVIVNDSLILVDFINKRIEKGVEVKHAIVDAGRTRLRPILLTSITTIVALIPLIYGIGGEEPFVAPACIVMAYGLLAATSVTLVIVPSFYMMFKGRVKKVQEEEVVL